MIVTLPTKYAMGFSILILNTLPQRKLLRPDVPGALFIVEQKMCSLPIFHLILGLLIPIDLFNANIACYIGTVNPNMSVEVTKPDIAINVIK
jgi:hypothetical protein|tara:strand:- start:2853 stop:3128 length:276 start_codon:yes stop_codon:yes gene_type:complete